MEQKKEDIDAEDILNELSGKRKFPNKQNKQLRNILIGIVIFIIVIAGLFLFFCLKNQF